MDNNMDHSLFENETFASLPTHIECSNFFNCTFNAGSAFERSNIENCVFTVACSFDRCNLRACTLPDGCSYDKTNVITKEEMEEMEKQEQEMLARHNAED